MEHLHGVFFFALFRISFRLVIFLFGQSEYTMHIMGFGQELGPVASPRGHT